MKIFHDPAFDSECTDQVAYGFFGRTGGVSDGIFASLNCALGTTDDPARVSQNRALVAQQLGLPGEPVSTLYQCHSADCLTIDSPLGQGPDRPKADAFVTDTPGLILGVLTADCGPVLFTGKKKNGAPVIAAAHAGWGGALKGILEATLEKMEEAGAVTETITACVGPCIMQASYEVKEDFARPFLIQHEEAEKFFMSARKQGHLMFDLPGYIAMRLALAGVRRVSLMGLDTYADEGSFFSYRRSTHRAEADYGRQISAIVINP